MSEGASPSQRVAGRGEVRSSSAGIGGTQSLRGAALCQVWGDGCLRLPSGQREPNKFLHGIFFEVRGSGTCFCMWLEVPHPSTASPRSRGCETGSSGQGELPSPQKCRLHSGVTAKSNSRAYFLIKRVLLRVGCLPPTPRMSWLCKH